MNDLPFDPWASHRYHSYDPHPITILFALILAVIGLSVGSGRIELPDLGATDSPAATYEAPTDE